MKDHLQKDAPGGNWEHYHHMADVGVRGYGSTVEIAFEQAAKAMTAVITDLDKINSEREIKVTCQAPDIEMLLVDWLNSLIYEMATQHMLFCCFQVHIDQLRLQGSAWGELVDVKKHAPAVETKGATYTTLAVRQQENGIWLAQCVIDV